MTETTDHPTPRESALALITTAALDEAARNDPAADGPPPANSETYTSLRSPAGLITLKVSTTILARLARRALSPSGQGSHLHKIPRWQHRAISC